MGACSSKSSNQVAQFSAPVTSDLKKMKDVVPPSISGNFQDRSNDTDPSQIVSYHPTTQKLNLSSDLLSASLQFLQSPRFPGLQGDAALSPENPRSNLSCIDRTESIAMQNSFDSDLPNMVSSPPQVATGLFVDTISPTLSARARVQYPSERELSTHRESSLKSMRKRAASLSIACESDDREEQDLSPDTSIDFGNNANVRLHSSLKNSIKSPHSRRKPSISLNTACGQEGRDSSSPCNMQRHSTDLLSPTAPTVPHAFSPRRTCDSPIIAQRALGLSRHDCADSLHKREISLTQHVLQKQLNVLEHLRSFDGNPQEQEDTQEYPPSQHFDFKSPFLSFRRLPSRSRQNSISISTPATPLTPTAANEKGVTVVSTASQLTPRSILVASPVVEVYGENNIGTPDSPRVAKVEWLWTHYAGRDSKTLGKKGLLQLAEDVFKDFCRKYKDRAIEIKRAKYEEQQSKNGKLPRAYTESDAERDLRADLPLLLPASSSKSGCEPEAQDYVKHICKFLYVELKKDASDGLASFGKGHKRTSSMQVTPNGTGSFRARSNSVSMKISDSGLESFINRIEAGDGAFSSGLESFSSPSSKVLKININKKEFILGWKRTQDILFQVIDRMKSPNESGDSMCKLM